MFETRKVLFESRSATKKDGFQVLFETLSREAPPKDSFQILFEPRSAPKRRMVFRYSKNSHIGACPYM